MQGARCRRLNFVLGRMLPSLSVRLRKFAQKMVLFHGDLVIVNAIHMLIMLCCNNLLSNCQNG